jgi:hypothetical protein
MERDNESKQKLLTEYRFGTMFSLTDPNARNTIEHFIVLCYEVRDFMKDFHKSDVDHKEILKRCIFHITENNVKPYKTGVIDMMKCVRSYVYEKQYVNKF